MASGHAGTDAPEPIIGAMHQSPDPAVFDPEALRAFAGGDAALVRELCGDFMEATRTDCVALRAAMAPFEAEYAQLLVQLRRQLAQAA